MNRGAGRRLAALGGAVVLDLVATGAGAGSRLELATSADDAAPWTVSAPYAPG